MVLGSGQDIPQHIPQHIPPRRHPVNHDNVRGHVAYSTYCGATHDRFCENLQIRYNLESYFVPEGEGREIGRDRNQHKLMVVAAVAPSGRAAIKWLLVDGKAPYEEPWF